MRLPLALALLALCAGAALAPAQAPPPVLRIDKADAAKDEAGTTFYLVLGTDAPTGTVLRTTLLLDKGMVAWNLVPKDGPEDTVLNHWGPIPGLVSGTYTIRLEISAQDQDPTVRAAHPEFEKAAPVTREVSVGERGAETSERAKYRTLYLATAKEFHELWMGIWHRTEAAVQSLFFLKHSKPPRLTEEKKKTVQQAWQTYVEGEYVQRLKAATLALEQLGGDAVSAYQPEVRNELLNHAALLRRARSGAWRRIGPLIGEKAPEDTKRDPSIPPPSLVRNVSESYQRLVQSLGEETGLLVLPEFPCSPEHIAESREGGRLTVTWKTLGSSITAPAEWSADGLPGRAPLLCLLASADGARQAELSLFVYPPVAGEAALRERVEAEARAEGTPARDLAPFDPRLSAKGGRAFFGWTAALERNGRAERAFYLCEVAADKSRAWCLRFHGPDATEAEFRAWRRQTGWPSDVTEAPEPASTGGGGK